MNYNARIFITYHKPSKLLNGFNCVTPIHGGRVLRTATKDGDIHTSDIDWLLHNTIGDDSGENISKKNREYCELTSLYWVYKNYDLSQCSHVGFMQYRRHFIFKEGEFSKSKNDFEAEAFSIKRYKTINPDYINAVGLTEGKILEYIHNYDCIIPYYGNLARAGVDSIWLDYAQQIPGLHIDDLCSLRKVFSEKFPEDLELFDEYLSQPKKLMYLMFILRKDIFMDYCRFLFDTLFSVERKIDSSLYTLNGRRTMGFLGEILYGYYFAKLKRNYQLKVKELGVSLVMDTGV